MTKERNKYTNLTCTGCGEIFNTRTSGVLAEIKTCRKCVIKRYKVG